MSGSKKTETQTARTDPYAPSQPLLGDILQKARGLGTSEQFTPTYSDATRDAVTRTADYGRSTGAQAPVLEELIAGARSGYGPALETLTKTASGGMLGANPYLDQVLQTTRQRAADAVNAQFSGAGRYGSGAHESVLADRLGAIETDARMRDYQGEREKQLAAAGLLQGAGERGAAMAGQLDAATLQRLGVLAQAGQQQDAIDNAGRLAPMNAVDWQAKLALPIAGAGRTSEGTTTTTTPANVGGMIGGAAMAGLGLATGNPMLVAGGLSGATGANMGSGGKSGSSFAGEGKPFFGLFGNGGGGSFYSPAQSASMNGYF